jgi:putative phosphoribosyl transferase
MSTCRELRTQVDDIVCLRTPRDFSAVGLWYEDFSQTTDEEVRRLLGQSIPAVPTIH